MQVCISKFQKVMSNLFTILAVDKNLNSYWKDGDRHIKPFLSKK